MAKQLRGEIERELGGTTYTLRLGLGELEELDNEMDIGTVDLMLEMGGTSAKASRVVSVLRQALPPDKNGKKKARDEVRKIVTAAGWVASVAACADILAAVLVDTKPGNVDAPEETETPQTGA